MRAGCVYAGYVANGTADELPGAGRHRRRDIHELLLGAAGRRRPSMIVLLAMAGALIGGVALRLHPAEAKRSQAGTYAQETPG